MEQDGCRAASSNMHTGFIYDLKFDHENEMKRTRGAEVAEETRSILDGRVFATDSCFCVSIT